MEETVFAAEWPTATDGRPVRPDDPRWKEIYGERVPRAGPAPTAAGTSPLPVEFGRNIKTIQEARQWLTNPHNWHRSSLFILKWNGLLVTVDRTYGEALWRETWDDGLSMALLVGQKQIRAHEGQPEAPPALEGE